MNDKVNLDINPKRDFVVTNSNDITPKIENADIVVDLSGGKLLFNKLRERINSLQAQIEDMDGALVDAVKVAARVEALEAENKELKQQHWASLNTVRCKLLNYTQDLFVFVEDIRLQEVEDIRLQELALRKELNSST